MELRVERCGIKAHRLILVSAQALVAVVVPLISYLLARVVPLHLPLPPPPHHPRALPALPALPVW
jgi:hypothetical protein